MFFTRNVVFQAWFRVFHGIKKEISWLYLDMVTLQQMGRKWDEKRELKAR